MPNEDVVIKCAGCGEDICESDDVYVVNGEILHADWHCLVMFIDPDYYPMAKDAVKNILSTINFGKERSKKK